MKLPIQKIILRIVISLGCLLNTSILYAGLSTWTFVKPMRYCVPQSVWLKIANRDVLEYHHVIGLENHQYQNGDVFVMFSQKGSPNVQWLYNSDGKWSMYNDSKDPVAYYSGELQPVQRIGIVLRGKKLAALQNYGDGYLLVGYGLRNSASATIKDSFQDMKDNARNILIRDGFSSNDTDDLCWNISEAWMNTSDFPGGITIGY